MIKQIDKQTLILKKGGKRSFSYKTKASMLFISMRRMSLWFTVMKRKEKITWIYFYPNWQMKFDSKNWWKEKLFLWCQNINSFIPMSKMSLWFLIMKRKEIITWIHVYPNWQINLDSKNGGKRSFSYETKASMSFIPIRKMSLWFTIMKRKGIITRIRFYPNWQANFDSKNWRKEKLFFQNQNIHSPILMSKQSL